MPREHIRPTKLHLAICFTILLFVGLIALICSLALRPQKPKFELHNFAVIGKLDRANGFESARIFFNVSAHNPNRRLRISYETMTVAVYYGQEQIGSTMLFGPFFQESENTTYIYPVGTGGVMAGNYGQPRMEVTNGTQAQGVVEFRLELKSVIRYRKTILDLKKHRLNHKCKVPVGSDGILLSSYANKKCS